VGDAVQHADGERAGGGGPGGRFPWPHAQSRCHNNVRVNLGYTMKGRVL
jgi:hypothetical protein